MIRQKINLILGGFIFLVAIYLFQKYRIAPDIRFQEITLEDIHGKPYNIADISDKHIFINIYASWCGPCVKEMPSLDRAAAQLKDDYVFLTVSDENWNLTKKFARFQHFKLLKMTQSREELGVHTIPTSYVLNPKGEVIFTTIGEREWDAPSTITELLELTK